MTTKTERRVVPPPKRSKTVVESEDYIRFICRDCGGKFKRRRQRGRVPVRCSTCRENRELAKRATAHEVTITCAVCNEDFVCERRRGRLPSICSQCKEKKGAVRKPLPLPAIDPKAVTRQYRKRLRALREQYDAEDCWGIPRHELHAAQEWLRQEWCKVYGRPWTLGGVDPLKEDA